MHGLAVFPVKSRENNVIRGQVIFRGGIIRPFLLKFTTSFTGKNQSLQIQFFPFVYIITPYIYAPFPMQTIRYGVNEMAIISSIDVVFCYSTVGLCAGQ
jgi:hypothetical protein